MAIHPSSSRELVYTPTPEQGYAFELRHRELRPLRAGEVLVRNLLVSCDPTQFAWLNAGSSYAPRIQAGEVMRAWCAGHVVESRHAGFAPGARVWGTLGWQDYSISDGSGSLPLAHVPEGVPLSYPLGLTGINGVTAHIGMLEIGRPAKGETVVVSTAAGATGSVAAQLARNRGARVIGIAGGSEKCAWLRESLKLTAAIDYKSQDLERSLREHCPRGIDVYFDNVGGPTLDTVLAQMADHGRIALCGATSLYAGGSGSLQNGLMLLARRLTVRGFVVMDHRERFAPISAELTDAARRGEVGTREDIVHGLESAPLALLRLLQGHNLGKQLVQLEAASELEPLLCAPAAQSDSRRAAAL